jgi:hypothetical protein
MNTSINTSTKTSTTRTTTRLQRVCLVAVAAAVVTGPAWLGSPATATTDVGSGACGYSDDSTSGTFDIGEYVAHRKALAAQDRVNRGLL